ncbi:MAG: hypothetical protein ABIR30_14780 [Chitinophagaceae bacterium]
MITQINRDNVKTAFEEKIKEVMSRHDLPLLGNLLDSAIEFFENYKIENVSTDYPDEDMLLFEYGIFDWQDGKGENFTVDIARQYVMEIEPLVKYSTIHLMAYYNKEDFTTIEAFSKWSEDFDSISDFKEFVMNTEGFLQAEDKSFASYDVFLVEGE